MIFTTEDNAVMDAWAIALALENARAALQSTIFDDGASQRFVRALENALATARETVTVLPIDSDTSMDHFEIARLLTETIEELRTFMSELHDGAPLVSDRLDARVSGGMVAGLILGLPEFFRRAKLPDDWLGAPSTATA